jgi:hypothetical protein
MPRTAAQSNADPEDPGSMSAERSETSMTLDDASIPPDETARRSPSETSSSDAMNDIWSSIGPGRPDSGDDGPPTIRPRDLPGTTPDSSPEKDLNPVSTPAFSDADESREAMRDELRIGVRMLEALDLQLKRAEQIIQRQEEATRLADQASTRLADRLTEFKSASETSMASGSLSLDSHPARVSTSDPQIEESTAELTRIIEAAAAIRTDFRDDLAAVTTAAASLADAVTQAGEMEASLQSTITSADAATPSVGSTPAASIESVADVLRRLAREFDAASAEASATSPPVSHAPFESEAPRSVASINPHERRTSGTLEVERTVEFDLRDGPPESSLAPERQETTSG